MPFLCICPIIQAYMGRQSFYASAASAVTEILCFCQVVCAGVCPVISRDTQGYGTDFDKGDNHYHQQIK